MAADLAMVEDQRQGISQKPDHGQHDQRRGLVHGRVFEMTVGGDGLKNLGIDSPPAAAELMDEQRRCPASTIFRYQRQLFFPIEDNYKLGKTALLPYTGSDRSRG